MAVYCDWALQQAVFTQLAASAALEDWVGGRVYDHAPPDAAYPYVVLGGMESRPHGTQVQQGRDYSMTLTAYSQAAGMKEARGILAAMAQAFDAPLDVAGQHVALCRVEDMATLAENDGLTRRAILRLRIVTEEM